VTAAALALLLCAVQEREPLFPDPIDVVPKPIASDPSVRYDYDIVYVRARRAGDRQHKRFYTDFSQPVTMEPGADLMLLHPDGREELLAEGGDGAITDPIVSFDGHWVYFARIYDLRGASPWSPPAAGADLFKIHVPSRRLVRLTNQRFTPNTGAADWAPGYRGGGERTHFDYGVFNMGPCPLPGGRLAFTSNRDGFRPPRGYPAVTLQLFVMDDLDGDVDPEDPFPGNIEKIGHLNLAGALHPVVLTDGRLMFSSLESQGIRSDISWGIWTIRPDGTGWAPLVSAFDPGGAANGFHFQTQLSDGSLVIEEYYNQNNSGFGAYIKMPASPPAGTPAFGPAHRHDPRNVPWRFGRFDNGKGKWYRMPFMPTGAVSMTPFALNGEGPADPSVLGQKNSPAVGKVTHPSGAPDGHLLTVWSPGPVNHQYTFLPQLDGGLYLIKGGAVIEEPGAMLLIKNDPNFNEGWPRALVPFERIYGVREPRRLRPAANDGSRSAHLPAGTPHGLVGTSSLLKRESYPDGAVPEGKVTATYAGGRDPWKGLDAFTSHGNGMPLNWHAQGADAGLYDNSQVHAVRILAMEPTTDRHRGERSGRRFFSHARERLRILGEIPVRKEAALLDPDGNPDTSFLAKIPADTPFSFQTLDRRGMVLNMAQTWHQLRPGEIRNDCGGCHAHSQRPTDFSRTAAARPDYAVWDLTETTPLLEAAGLRRQKGPVADVEYFRDVRPILRRSCVPCHSKARPKPEAELVLDDDEEVPVEHWGKFPGTYVRLALDERAAFGRKPPTYDSWGYPNASRYVRMFQSRRSLLVWKIFGERLDGFSNDDHPSEPEPGAGGLVHRGKPVQDQRHYYDIDYAGEPMPPPAAATAGARPLADEDRFTIVRWIDLGCPIDLDHGRERGFGWMADDLRPTLTVAVPRAGANPPLERLLVGMADATRGLAPGSFRARADVEIDGVAAGAELADRFVEVAPGVRQWRLSRPLTRLERARLSVSVKDLAGNETRIERTFSVDALPRRVHVVEDYETDIERRWWMAGTIETQDVPPGSRRACRASLTRDFDDKMGDRDARYKAVIFNPVPGPPMGPRTRLRFRAKLAGTDRLRVQIYSLTNNYHRRLELEGLPQGRWLERDVDMTLLRRPDGSGGPLSADERIDDIQFYVEPNAELLIDDIVLYEAAREGEGDGFPRRAIFTAWFDTGKQGAEWPGDFEIVNHEPPRGWKAARSAPGAVLRVGMRGRRLLGDPTEVRFAYRLDGAAGPMRVELSDSTSGNAWAAEVSGAVSGAWATAVLRVEPPLGAHADEVRFRAPAGAALTIDDLLLSEPE
jgi:hypothetical protein